MYGLGSTPEPDTLSYLNNIMPVSNIRVNSEANAWSRACVVATDMSATFPAVADFCETNEAPYALIDPRGHGEYNHLHLDQHDISDGITIDNDDSANLTLSEGSIDAVPRLNPLLKTTTSSTFPRYGPAVCYSDKAVHNFIEEALKEHQAHRFDLRRPSLRRLLANMPADCLSFRVFHFVSEIPAPLQNMLAIFWVQYLYLRVRHYPPWVSDTPC